MKQGLRCQRILILSLLSLSVLAPMFLVSRRLSNLTSFVVHKEFVEDLSTIKYRTDTLKLNAIQQETEGVKEPELVLYKDGEFNSVVTDDGYKSLDRNDSETYQDGMEDHRRLQQETLWPPLVEKEQVNHTRAKEGDVPVQTRGATDEKVREMKDQVIRAKAYLNFAPPTSNSHLVKELKLRIKVIDRAVDQATKDADLPRSALQKMKSMEASLTKASRVYTDCSAMATKLRAMTYNVDEQLRTQKSQANFLIHLASRTTPKGQHCLSMRLTADYFALDPGERQLSNHQKLNEPNLYHYALFSDNILACSVVVNSTVSASMDPEKVVFHVVTDGINFPAMTMWFLSNPPGQATIQIKSIDDFEWLSSKYGSLRTEDSQDSRYTSSLNHLRFYLPEMFPALDKIVLLDHDVVVQRDLRGLWSVDMKGKVNGAVETCRENDPSFHRMDTLINFSDPTVAKIFDVNACMWAFGMNVFDLNEWRRHDLTSLYRKYLDLGKNQQICKAAGSLPLGLVTFYNQTVALDRRWHALGLGYESGIGQGEIERAAVIHYDGIMKPWLDIGVVKYKGYWNRYVNYHHPYLQQCNIHE